MNIYRTPTTPQRLGLGVVNPSQELAQRLGLPAGSASVLVAEVTPGSLAEAANLHAGDVLLAVDGQEVDCALQAYSAIQKARQRGAKVVELLIQHARETRCMPLRLSPGA